ncbi:hypothetical protein Osc1_03600 [Hominimerdicola sp. 21CYCFAH17_S]
MFEANYRKGGRHYEKDKQYAFKGSELIYYNYQFGNADLVR